MIHDRIYSFPLVCHKCVVSHSSGQMCMVITRIQVLNNSLTLTVTPCEGGWIPAGGLPMGGGG